MGSYVHQLVGLPRIELGLHEAESCVLPVYYSPLPRHGLDAGHFTALFDFRQHTTCGILSPRWINITWLCSWES